MTQRRPTTSRQAAIVGEKVMAGFDRGRQRAIQLAKEQASRNIALIVPLANADIRAGKPLRGRAGRICRKLKGAVTERSVKRILDRLFSLSD